MSNLAVQLAGAPALAPRSQVLTTGVDPNAIMGGIGPSFGILTFRGKVFRVKYRGEELALMMDPPGPGMPSPGPKPFCDVVIVSASPAISKIFYEDAYQEGDTDAPDCFSTNGVTPDPASPKKQAELCATCPKNIWGSRANANTGAKGKACQDSKRLAVVPLDDMANERLGGPLLLRIPPASLQNMGNYNTYLQNQGHVFYSVGTRLQFDPEAAYPKLTFYPIKGLGDGEATLVKELQNDPRVIRMLQEAVDQVRDAGVGGLPAAGAQAATQPAAVPAGAPQPAVYVAPQATAQAVQVAQPAQPAPTTAAPPMPVVQVAPATPAPQAAPPMPTPTAPPAVPVAVPGKMITGFGATAPAGAVAPPVAQPVAQPVDQSDLTIPPFLRAQQQPANNPGIVAGQPPQPATAPVVAPVVPTPAPAPTVAFRELEPAEMAALASSDPAGLQKYFADLAAWKAAGGGKKSRAKRGTTQPSPSPAPTPIPETAVASPALPAAAAPATAPLAVAPAQPAAAVAGSPPPPMQDAALAHLDETLLKAL